MKKQIGQLIGLDPRFHYRGMNQTRIEAFSDAVFAVAFTLVVLSMSVPETFEELRKSINDILPSFICIVLIVVIWYQHYIFFLRYGLQNTKTIVVNTLLLFFLLIYVYPLKFLARFLVELYSGLLFGRERSFINDFGGELNGDNMSLLMTAYGAGATLIFASIAWLYRHAYGKRVELDLSEYESFATKASLYQNLWMSSIPFLSTLVTIIQPFGNGPLNYAIAGFIYMLYPPVMILFGKRIKRLSKQQFG